MRKATEEENVRICSIAKDLYPVLKKHEATPDEAISCAVDIISRAICIQYFLPLDQYENIVMAKFAPVISETIGVILTEIVSESN